MLTYQAATGCSWTFATAGQAPIVATMEREAYCMLEAGQCYILNWLARRQQTARHSRLARAGEGRHFAVASCAR